MWEVLQTLGRSWVECEADAGYQPAHAKDVAKDHGHQPTQIWVDALFRWAAWGIWSGEVGQKLGRNWGETGEKLRRR